MNKLYLFLIFTLFYSANCTQPKRDNQDLTGLLQLIGAVEPKFLFSFPGRNVSEASKLKVKNTVLRMISETSLKIEGYIYGLNDLDILIALRAAKKRGVEITLIGDREEDYSEAESFGLTIKRWRGSGIHHLKILIFDEEQIFLGTGNFTNSGLTRDNNVFWTERVSKTSYQQLISILKEEEGIGIFNLDKRKYFFAPQAGYLIQDTILEAVRSAKKNIRYMIYTHYDPLLSYELTAACRRGVMVEGIYNDPVNLEGQILSTSLPYPCKIYSDGNVDIMYREGSYSGGLLHHKTMIIDHTKVLVGSYNYTVSARDENREFFTEFSDSQSVDEFLGEWMRVKSLTKQISELDDDALTDQKLFRMNASLFSILLLADKSYSKPYLNKNSSGLSKEINQSLAILDSLTPGQGAGFSKSRDSEEYFQTPPIFQWLQADPRPLHSFSAVTFWDKIQVQTNPSLEIESILVWDGKKSPTQYQSLSNNLFPVELLDQWKAEKWILFDTGNGYYFSCTQKKNEESSKWINYLKQKQVLKGFLPSVCNRF